MKKYYSMDVNAAERSADVYIFGDIVDAWNTGIDEAWGLNLGEVSGLSIANDIKGLDVDTINVHINSCGGYTSEGLAIYNTLKCHSAKVRTYCDGFACSAASIVFMAGDERIMSSASALMIHNAWAGMAGNAAQHRQEADVLDKISQAAGNAYAEKVNIGREELDAMLDGVDHEGSWILPDDALKMGFATLVTTEKDSSIANQSVMRQIIQRMTVEARPASALTVKLDAADFRAELAQQISEIKSMLENAAPKPETKITNRERLEAALGKKVSE